MQWWQKLFNRRRLERQLDAELQFHLDEQIREYTESGMTEAEARRAARLEFGVIDSVKDDCRQVRALPLVETTIHDLRFAFRGMRKSWVFTLGIVFSLALGIGANTAIFSLINAVMWRMLPVQEPEKLLVVARAPGAAPETGFTYKQFRAMRDDNLVADVAGYAIAPINVSVNGGLEPTADGQLVSGNYFSLLGVNPIAGRPIGPDDDRVANGHPVAMISYGYWSRRFGRDSQAIGKTISVGGMPFTIIGVTPAEFFGVEVGAAPDIFVPMMMQPAIQPAFENLLANPLITKTWVQTIARLKPGVSAEQAAAVLQPLERDQIPPPPPGVQSGLRDQKLVLKPAATGLSDLRRQFSQPLYILMTIVAIVLLIACANTANLILARAAARRAEFAMRLALGSGRRRLLQQLVMESVALAALGGVAGILLARWSTHLLLLYMSSGRNPIVLDLNPDLRVLLFTAAVSVLTGLLFGFAPAIKATRIDLMPSLKNAAAANRVRGGLRPGKILAVAQVSLSLLLLITAGLFVRSLQNLNRQDAGFSRDSVLVARVEPKGSDQRGLPGVTQRLDRIYTDLLQTVRDIPGVRSASLGNVSPLKPESGAGSPKSMPSGKVIATSGQVVYPGYFETLGMPLVAGRDFESADMRETSSAVCIVNETFARKFFPGEDPLGKTCGGTLRSPGTNRAAVSGIIIGVVKDSRYTNLKGATQAVRYAPFLFANTGRGQMILYVRSAGDQASILPPVREAVWRADTSVPQFAIHTLAEEVDAALIQDRMIAILSGLFSLLALLLACVGLYGLLSFTIVQRAGEMGVRMALGAMRGDVVRMIMRESLLLVCAGIVLAGPLAWMAGRLAATQISGFLFGLEANDPLTIAGATCLLAAVAALASYIPARRASRVDPMIALRNE